MSEAHTSFFLGDDLAERVREKINKKEDLEEEKIEEKEEKIEENEKKFEEEETKPPAENREISPERKPEPENDKNDESAGGVAGAVVSTVVGAGATVVGAGATAVGAGATAVGAGAAVVINAVGDMVLGNEDEDSDECNKIKDRNIDGDGEDVDFDDDDDDENEGKKKKKRGVSEGVGAGTSLAAIGSQGAAVFYRPGLPVYVSSSVGVVAASTSIKTQRDKRRGRKIIHLQNQMMRELDRLQKENEELTENVNGLETTVNRLKESEKQFEEIANKQNVNVSTLLELAKENNRILDEMKTSIEATVAQDVVKIVLTCDRDGDFTINDHEIDILLLRLRHIKGIIVDGDKLRERVHADGGSVSAVMDIVRQMGDDSIPEEERIFRIKAKIGAGAKKKKKKIKKNNP